MWPAERLLIARQTYARAVVTAAARSTPRNWRGLLTAARNVAEALRAEGQQRARPTGPPPRIPSPLTPAPRVEARRPAPRRRAGPSPDVTWLAIVAEWERAHRLVAEARRLVDEARRLSVDPLLGGAAETSPR